MNRKQLVITITMLEAGERAMALCRETGEHSPRTACHAIFQAMLAASDWSPLVRVRPLAKPKITKPTHPLDWYDGKSVGPFTWYGFHPRTGFHYLKQSDPEKWIRLTDKQWKNDDLTFALEHYWYSIPALTARNAMRIK